MAQNAYNAARKIAQAAHRRYKDQATSKPSIIITVNPLLKEHNPLSDGQAPSGVVNTVSESVRSVGGTFNQPLKSKIDGWLVASFKLPTAPGNDVLDMITTYCRDEEGLAQLQMACAKLTPRGWIVFVEMAKRCAEHRENYEIANTTAAGSNSEKRRPKWAEGL